MFFIAIVIGVLFAAGYFFIEAKGADILVEQLEKILNKKVSISEISLRFPISIELKDIEIEDLVTADDLYIRPSIAGLFAGKIILSKAILIKPKIYLERLRDGSLSIPWKAAEGESSSDIPISINLIVKDGSVEFIDRSVDSAGFKSSLDNVNINLSTDIVKMFAKYSLSARIITGDESAESSVSVNGWAKLLSKDMDTEIIIANLEGAYFRPYFQRFLGDEKLKTANISSNIDLKAKNNQIEGVLHLEIKDIEFEKPDIGDEGEKSINPFAMVMGVVAGETKEIVMDLPISGELYPFKLDKMKIGATIGSKVIQDSILKQPEKIPESIKEIGETFEDIGKEFKRAFEGE